jgi:hypothetical protein
MEKSRHGKFFEQTPQHRALPLLLTVTWSHSSVVLMDSWCVDGGVLTVARSSNEEARTGKCSRRSQIVGAHLGACPQMFVLLTQEALSEACLSVP